MLLTAARLSRGTPTGHWAERYGAMLPRARQFILDAADAAPIDHDRCACCGRPRPAACHIARLPVCRGCALAVYRPAIVAKAARRLKAMGKDREP
jgi:hypothetical protein